MPARQAPVSTLIAGMFLTGVANSIFSKYQDMECVENCSTDTLGPRIYFEQPVWQTLNMFIGEFGCCIPIVYSYLRNKHRKASAAKYSVLAQDEHVDDGSSDLDEVETEAPNALSGTRMLWMWFPAFFDICGTTLMNVGLILTPVSIYQMTRGALVLWVGVLSVIFLRRRLYLYQWASLVTVMVGVCIVGLSGSLTKSALEGKPKPGEPGGGVDLLSRAISTMEGHQKGQKKEDDPATVFLGVLLILFAQVFTACQYVVEEKIMSHYQVAPLAAVSLEGFFGLVTVLIAMPFLHIFLHTKSPYFDIPRGWYQIIHTPNVLWSCFVIMFSIGSFNYFGLSVTSRVSATTRSTVDTCRTIGIWIVSLGLGWEQLVWPFSLLQVLGFVLLVYGTFVFNGLLPPTLFCAPPAGVQLPHEPALEETATLPAASEQGRAGYDVVPDR